MLLYYLLEMCNFLLCYFLECINIMLNLIYLKKEAKSFVNFVQDDFKFKEVNKNEKGEKDYETKINELEKYVKELETNLKEEKIKNENLNKRIEKLENMLNRSPEKKHILELDKEIELFREYNKFTPEEKLLSIKFVSVFQDISFTIVEKNTTLFSDIEKILYNKYQHYKPFENYFLANGQKINRNLTLKENNIRDNIVITLGSDRDD